MLHLLRWLAGNDHWLTLSVVIENKAALTQMMGRVSVICFICHLDVPLFTLKQACV